MRKKYTNEFIDLQLKNRNISRTENVLSSKHRVKWKCNLCNFIWSTSAENIIRNQSGCPSCYTSNKKINDDDIKSRLENRKIINIESINNKNVNFPILWKCLVCSNKWYNTTHNIINKQQGCKQCYIIKRKQCFHQTSDILAKRNILLITKKISHAHSKLTVQCLNCDTTWKATYNNLINRNSGCPTCTNTSHSKKALEWLRSIEEKENITIQHAENGGEYKIPGTKFKADGYCKETNTIYEFYGDYWHGNPKLYNKNKKHAHLNITFGEVYEKTLLREIEITNNYNLVSIWENDYDNQKNKKKS